ncbi:MAG: hypothetical protein HWE20_03695 [Gammaproteobacteria bacterium]|nr:hypothetical protein [Gammaproteobacteria bacterium]
MRDLRLAFKNSREKLVIFGFWGFILKSMEVLLMALLAMKKFSLKPSKIALNNVPKIFSNHLELRIKDDSVCCSAIMEDLCNYRYRVFDQLINLRSDKNIDYFLPNVRNLLKGDEYDELLSVFGKHHNTRWDYDPIHEYIFDDLKIPYGVAEIKVPWEVGRFNLYPQLAIHTEEIDRLSFIFSRDVISFMSSNASTSNSVQWANAMEAGIRIFNVISTYSILKGRKARFCCGFDKLIGSLIDMHFKYILFNNEYSFFQTSNHFAANLLGLASINLHFNSQTYTNFLISLLRKEVFRNTDDGLLNEGSISYHRFTSEMYFTTYLLLSEKAGVRCLDLEDTFSAMAKVPIALENPLGLHTQFGDSDGGFLNWLVFPYSVVLNTYTPYVVINYSLFVDWFFKRLGLVSPRISGSYNTFGGNQLAVFRSENLYVAINNIKQSQNIYNKTHFHDDHGYPEIFYKGRAILVDAGTYCYTLDLCLMAKYRGAVSHLNQAANSISGTPFGDFERNMMDLFFEKDDMGFVYRVRVKGSCQEIILFDYNAKLDDLRLNLNSDLECRDIVLIPNYLSEPILLVD